MRLGTVQFGSSILCQLAQLLQNRHFTNNAAYAHSMS
jgi:hypothetical protein